MKNYYPREIRIIGNKLIFKSKNENICIDLDECSQNFAKLHLLEKSICVATRDVTKLEYTFFTNPNIKVTFKKVFLLNILCFHYSLKKFQHMNKIILEAGYSSYDLT